MQVLVGVAETELRATNVTIIGDSPSTSTGVQADAFTSRTARVTLANSVLRNVDTSLEATGSGTVVFVTDHSSYDFSATNGPVLPSPSDVDDNSASHFVAPAFANPAAGDYRLRHSSPLLDAGSASVAGLGPQDLRRL